MSEPLIDDFEAPGLPPHDGREGGWYVYNDGSGGTQIPANTIERTEQDAYGGRFSARTRGYGFDSWGAAMALAIQTTGLESAGNCPYDASAFDGIRFWARGEGEILFHITTMDTAPPEQGGRCTASVDCWDDFGSEISLAQTWTHYAIAWDALAQAGWGLPATFDPREILLLHWQDQSASSFDIMLDDVEFYRIDASETDTDASSESSATTDGTAGGTGSETEGDPSDSSGTDGSTSRAEETGSHEDTSSQGSEANESSDGASSEGTASGPPGAIGSGR